MNFCLEISMLKTQALAKLGEKLKLTRVPSNSTRNTFRYMSSSLHLSRTTGTSKPDERKCFGGK
jgi:hypothetical protein